MLAVELFFFDRLVYRTLAADRRQDRRWSAFIGDFLWRLALCFWLFAFDSFTISFISAISGKGLSFQSRRSLAILAILAISSDPRSSAQIRGKGLSFQSLLGHGEVRIVATATGGRAFFHVAMERLGRILDQLVALITERRLRVLEQRRLHPRCVDGMAIDAAHVFLRVHGLQESSVLFAELVARQATLRRFRPRRVCRAKDLVGIAGFGVILSRTVAGFASLELWAFMVGQDFLAVRAFVVTRPFLLVATFAGFWADKLRRINGRLLSGCRAAAGGRGEGIEC